jgi:hypothetical protein
VLQSRGKRNSSRASTAVGVDGIAFIRWLAAMTWFSLSARSIASRKSKDGCSATSSLSLRRAMCEALRPDDLYTGTAGGRVSKRVVLDRGHRIEAHSVTLSVTGSSGACQLFVSTPSQPSTEPQLPTFEAGVSTPS